MADAFPLEDLLDRASQVFLLAGELGTTFQKEHEDQRGGVVHSSWGLHQPKFDEFCQLLFGLREVMQKPLAELVPLAKPLRDAASVARQIAAVMKTRDGRFWASYQEFFLHLNSVAFDGWHAIKQIDTSRSLVDPFEFLNQPTEVNVTGTTRPGRPPEADEQSSVQQSIPQTEVSPPELRADRETERAEDHEGDHAAKLLLSVFTNGLADTRFSQAVDVIKDAELSTNDKLERIDSLMRIPSTASAQALGDSLGVSKQAVMKTEWWKRNRKDEKVNQIGRRKSVHKERGQQRESSRPGDESN